MAELRNYRKDIEIDENNLEDEWIVHPSNYLEYADIYAEAIEKRDNVKLKLEWIEANLDLDIRKNPAKYGFDTKPAEGAIKNTIKIQSKFREQSRLLIKATRRVNSMTGVKTAFEHKKHALGNLVSAKIAGFHAEPRNKVRDLQKVVNYDMHNKHKQNLSDTMKNRKIKKQGEAIDELKDRA